MTPISLERALGNLSDIKMCSRYVLFTLSIKPEYKMFYLEILLSLDRKFVEFKLN